MVLDGVDGSEGSPVLGGWDSFDWKGGSLGLVLWHSLESEEFFVLVLGPGGHEVVANGEGVGWVSVDLSVFSGLGLEDLLSEHIFFLGTVGDTVGGDVLEEVGVGVDLGTSEGGFKELHFVVKLIDY